MSGVLEPSEIYVLPGRRDADPEKVRELAESIKMIGLLQPIVIDEHNILVAGLHRLRACELLGWPYVPYTVRNSRAAEFMDCEDALEEIGMTPDEADRRLAEIDENLIRNELTYQERCRQLAERKRIYEARFPETKKGGNKNVLKGRESDERQLSPNEQTARLVEAPEDPSGADDVPFWAEPEAPAEPLRTDERGEQPNGQTVRLVRTTEQPSGEPSEPGDVFSAAPPSFTEDTAAKMGVSPRTVRRDVRVGELPDDVHEMLEGTPVADSPTEMRRIAAAKDPEEQRAAARRALTSSKTNEWYTPAEYVEAARALMGGIDLDPASCERANGTVKATAFYTEEYDGFDKEWSGRVWLNPPYGLDPASGKSNQARWTARLIEQFEQGAVEQAVLLVNSKTGDAWFEPLWRYPICFVARRIRFVDSQGQPQKQPTHSNVLVYLGPDTDRFIEIFSQFGQVVVPDGNLSKAVLR